MPAALQRMSQRLVEVETLAAQQAAALEGLRMAEELRQANEKRQRELEEREQYAREQGWFACQPLPRTQVQPRPVAPLPRPLMDRFLPPRPSLSDRIHMPSASLADPLRAPSANLADRSSDHRADGLGEGGSGVRSGFSSQARLRADKDDDWRRGAPSRLNPPTSITRDAPSSPEVSRPRRKRAKRSKVPVATSPYITLDPPVAASSSVAPDLQSLARRVEGNGYLSDWFWRELLSLHSDPDWARALRLNRRLHLDESPRSPPRTPRGYFQVHLRRFVKRWGGLREWVDGLASRPRSEWDAELQGGWDGGWFAELGDPPVTSEDREWLTRAPFPAPSEQDVMDTHEENDAMEDQQPTQALGQLEDPADDGIDPNDPDSIIY